MCLPSFAILLFGKRCKVNLSNTKALAKIIKAVSKSGNGTTENKDIPESIVSYIIPSTNHILLILLKTIVLQ
jgi:hypothetical protein